MPPDAPVAPALPEQHRGTWVRGLTDESGGPLWDCGKRECPPCADAYVRGSPQWT